MEREQGLKSDRPEFSEDPAPLPVCACVCVCVCVCVIQGKRKNLSQEQNDFMVVRMTNVKISRICH